MGTAIEGKMGKRREREQKEEKRVSLKKKSGGVRKAFKRETEIGKSVFWCWEGLGNPLCRVQTQGRAGQGRVGSRFYKYDIFRWHGITSIL